MEIQLLLRTSTATTLVQATITSLQKYSNSPLGCLPTSIHTSTQCIPQADCMTFYKHKSAHINPLFKVLQLQGLLTSLRGKAQVPPFQDLTWPAPNILPNYSLLCLLCLSHIDWPPRYSSNVPGMVPAQSLWKCYSPCTESSSSDSHIAQSLNSLPWLCPKSPNH